MLVGFVVLGLWVVSIVVVFVWAIVVVVVVVYAVVASPTATARLTDIPGVTSWDAGAMAVLARALCAWMAIVIVIIMIIVIGISGDDGKRADNAEKVLKQGFSQNCA